MGLFGRNKPKTEEEQRESEINKLLDTICGKRLSTSPIFSYIVFPYANIGESGYCGTPFDTVKNILKKELINYKLTEDNIENRIIELIQLDYEQLRRISNDGFDTSVFHTQEDIINNFNDYNYEKFLENQNKIKESQLKFKEFQNNKKNTNISKNDFNQEIRRVVDGFYFKYKMAYLNFDEDNKDKIKKILELECHNDQLLVENIEDRAHELLTANNNLDEMKENLLKQNDGSFISNDSEDYDFSCSIDEIRTKWSGEKITDRRKCHVRVLEDKLIIQKTGVVIKSDLGNRIIYFSDISSIDFDKAGLLHVTSSITIILRGGEPVTLIYADEPQFNLLNGKWRNYKENQNKIQNPIMSQNIQEETNAQNIETSMSNADELLKYAELYEKGLLTEEEFNSLKQKLIGTQVRSSNKYCGNCGAEVSQDSKFCTECGTQIK